MAQDADMISRNILSRISPQRGKKEPYRMNRVNRISARKSNPFPKNTTQYDSRKYRKNISSTTKTKGNPHKTHTTENFLTL